MKEKMKMSGLRLPALFCALVILINIVFGLTVIRPQEARMRALEERSSSIRRALSGSPGAGSLERTASAVEAFKKSLPDKARLTGVIEEVHRAARLNGLRIPEGDYRPETTKEAGLSRYTLSFPVEGSYRQIKKFIYDIETSRYPLTVEDVTLASTRAREGVILLNLRVSVYFL